MNYSLIKLLKKKEAGRKIYRSSPPPHWSIEALGSERRSTLQSQLDGPDFTDRQKASNYIKSPAQTKASSSHLINDGYWDCALLLKKTQKPPSTRSRHFESGWPDSPLPEVSGPNEGGLGAGAARPGPVGTWQPLRSGATSRPGFHRPAGGRGRDGEVGRVGARRAGRRGPRRRAASIAGARGRGGRRRAVEVGQVERAGHEAAVPGRVQQPLSAAAVVQQLVHDHAPRLGARGPPDTCVRLPPAEVVAVTGPRRTGGRTTQARA